MLLFELELVELQKGVPEGYMFVWLGDGPDPLFPAMDLNGDKEVPLEEVSSQASLCLILLLNLRFRRNSLDNKQGKFFLVV